MQEIIKNHGNYSGGYFVKNTDSGAISAFEGGDGFFVSCQQHRGLLTELVNRISIATHYVKICSFIIDNRQIYDCLIRQMKERKLSVFILTAVNEQNIQSNLISEDEKTSVDTSRHFEYISQLVIAGAHIRASTNAHAKFLVCDGENALLMSANLTEPSLSTNENRNPPNDESGINIENLYEVSQLEKVFDSVFLYGTEFKRFITLNSKNQLIDHKDVDILSTDFPALNSDLLLSFEEIHQGIYQEIIRQIHLAKKSVTIATYSIVGLENLSELIEALTELIGRGGNVRLFCRAMNHRKDHLNACAKLATIGVEIFGDMFNHAKGLLRDEEEGILFTANIDGKHGLKSGFEVGFRLQNHHTSFSKFRQFLNFQIDNALFIFRLNPEKAAIYRFYEHWYERKRTVQVGIESNIEIKYKSNAYYSADFVNYINKFPIFYVFLTTEGKKHLIFEILDKQYKMEELNINTFELKTELKYQDYHKGARYLYKYQTISLTPYD